MPDEEPLYMGVPDPLDLRKDILNSSRMLLSSLKRYEGYTETTKEKERYVAELAKKIKELNILTKRMKQMMPKAKLKPGMIKLPPKPIAPKTRETTPTGNWQKPMQKPQEKQKEAPLPSIIREKSRLAQLEDELAQVEQKLKNLE